MKNRLKLLRKKLGLTQAKFASGIDMAQNSYSQIESGNTILTDKNITLICLTYGVNETWLRDGIGDMFDEEALLSDWEKHLLELFGKLSPTAQKLLIGYAEKMILDEKILREESLLASNRQSSPSTDFPLEPRRPTPDIPANNQNKS
jgi:transcriptional regulator with XRE-family HTH domain